MHNWLFTVENIKPETKRRYYQNLQAAKVLGYYPKTQQRWTYLGFESFHSEQELPYKNYITDGNRHANCRGEPDKQHSVQRMNTV